MPHKKNPDVWEILRGNCNMIQAAQNEISMMTTNLPHGYHRDYQLLKEVIFPSLEKMHSCLKMTKYMLDNISVNKDILKDKKYEVMFTVEEVNRLAASGIPFRDAYKTVGIKVNKGNYKFDGKRDKDGRITVSSLKHSHSGSIGNLCNKEIKKKMQQALF
jgi:argininosuccinate lyase